MSSPPGGDGGGLPPPVPPPIPDGGAPIVLVPPPFVMPAGASNLSRVPIVPADWKLSKKERKKCGPVDIASSSATKKLRGLNVPINCAETVVQLCAKKDKDGSLLDEAAEGGTLGEVSVKDHTKTLLVTDGAVLLKTLPFGVRNLLGSLRSGATPSTTAIELHDLRGVRAVPDSDLVILVSAKRADSSSVDDKKSSGNETVSFVGVNSMRYAFYQSPDPKTSIGHITSSLVAAYAGVPSWAIPVSWNLENLPRFHLSQEMYKRLIGSDGGFSSSVRAAGIAYHIAHKMDMNRFLSDKDKILQRQQPKRIFKLATAGPTVIDLTDFVKEYPRVLAEALVIAGFNALSFNLIFRKLIFSGVPIAAKTEKGSKVGAGAPSPAEIDAFRTGLRNAMSRMLLYNVTLRELVLANTDLSGYGRSLGGALAMNAQPLISKIDLTNCKLSKDDLEGLTHGLARVFCGGTALAESIVMGNNDAVPADTWDDFFGALVDPSSLKTWPQTPPPPPNLAFLQVLDVRFTSALGAGMNRFAKKLHGLKTLKVSAMGTSDIANLRAVLDSLSEARAPLEHFVGVRLDASCISALFLHSKSLKEVSLDQFVGDAGPLLSNWPHAVLNLTLSVGTGHIRTNSDEQWAPPPGTGFSPATICITNDTNFGITAFQVLSKGAPGLQNLVVNKMFYWQFVNAAPILAVCGLQSIKIYPPPVQNTASVAQAFRNHGLGYIESFWQNLAPSPTLRELQVPNQLLGQPTSDEVAMVGRFLKINRSVNRIGFDNSKLILNVEDVKVLRSAFYGNKKVTHLNYPQLAVDATNSWFLNQIRAENDNVSQYKAQIKRIFQQHYSKYNSNWRAKPNQLKGPWVDLIRVSKRRIGKLQRDQAKIRSLLNEIKVQVEQNKRERAVVDEAKANERLVRREAQLKLLAAKKQKTLASLVTKLNKAKARGRKNTSAKTQVPRYRYYKNRNVWPSNTPHTRHHREHSYYRHYNDPYCARGGYGYYGWGYPGYYPYGYYPYYGPGDETVQPPPPDDATQGPEEVDSETCQVWDDIYSDVQVESEDPWANVDALVDHMQTDYSSATSPAYLAALHEECSELGIDVVESVSGALDTGAAIDEKLTDVGRSVDVPPEVISNIVDSSPEHQLDFDALALSDVPKYEADGIDDFADTEGASEAVEMYAGAGPRDLDDEGPSCGGSSHAALSGARRRAQARKNRRAMKRIRYNSNKRLSGYGKLTIADAISKTDIVSVENDWPDQEEAKEEFESNLVSVMSESVELFDLPSASNDSHLLLTEWWVLNGANPHHLNSGIDVTLVTQCSLDRLPNLEAQLASWGGHASVAVYLKPSEAENGADIVHSILAAIVRARDTNTSTGGSGSLNVAVTLVEGCVPKEPYPINYLRNTALLEARRQHLRFNSTLETSAALLVDVDFRPSANLNRVLHSREAAKAVISQQKVVVVPAFETENAVLFNNGHAEGFHQSHFPQGHGPTQFDMYWAKSGECTESRDCWNELYRISHENLFEPYVIMATANVPLCDERFTGYGLNKVSHLASISKKAGGDFYVLPGAFLAAPAHERSESWAQRYGSSSDEISFNKLVLKGLFLNFTRRLEAGKEPVVSQSTERRMREQHQMAHELAETESEAEEQNSSVSVVPLESVACQS